MSTIIVFSKDRPMQLHAYLESILMFSDCEEKQIYVLYREVLPICYDDVKEAFPKVNWVAEDNFYEQMIYLVNRAEEFIMFGCDDVVFTAPFCMKDMEKYLDHHEQIFGFSLRLGPNINPVPRNLQTEHNVMTWDWTENKSHYGYPWELDCTLYRKSDVLKVLEQTGEVKSPNYLEAIPEENPQAFIDKKQLAAYKEKSKAIVITINRVQDTHRNGIDDSKNTDILSLYIKYHFEKQRLDIKRIACKNYKDIHVGSEYFILTSDEMEKSRQRNSGLRKIKQLIKNLRYLCGADLEGELREVHRSNLIHARLHSMVCSKRASKVLSPQQTLEWIRDNRKSFCRFGDGEFALMRGGDIGFQNYNPKLAFTLWEIFIDDNNKIGIGVPYQHFELPDAYNDWIKEFYYTSGKWIREFLYHFMPDEREYYLDTGFNQVYQTYQDMDFANYYEQVKLLFKGKKLTIIVGQGVLEKLKYNVFEYADSVEYQYAPTKNAYEVYQEILDNAMKVDKNNIICVILGPTAKVLIRDLTNAGYVAWDVGHLAKDYDAFCHRIHQTKENIGKFYAPD